jgi:acyl dehydratase
VEVGQWAEVKHVFGEAEVATFARLSGDDNPIHLDPTYAATHVGWGWGETTCLSARMFSLIADIPAKRPAL